MTYTAARIASLREQTRAYIRAARKAYRPTAALWARMRWIEGMAQR